MGYFRKWLNWLTEPTLLELEAAAVAAKDHAGLWLALAEAYGREGHAERAEWAYARAMALFRHGSTLAPSSSLDSSSFK